MQIYHTEDEVDTSNNIFDTKEYRITGNNGRIWHGIVPPHEDNWNPPTWVDPQFSPNYPLPRYPDPEDGTIPDWLIGDEDGVGGDEGVFNPDLLPDNTDDEDSSSSQNYTCPRCGGGFNQWSMTIGREGECPFCGLRKGHYDYAEDDLNEDEEEEDARLQRFRLVREEDESGVSGEGVVATGVEFPSGAVVLEWLNEDNDHLDTTSDGLSFKPAPDGIEDTRAVHGHGGKTKVGWIDE